MKATLQRLSLAASAGFVTAFSGASSALAQFAGPDPGLAGTPGAGDDVRIRDIVTNVINAVLSFLALVAVVVIVIAGIRLIISQGDEDAKEKAKKTIFYALIGLVIVLMARVIVGLVTVYLAGEVQ